MNKNENIVALGENLASFEKVLRNALLCVEESFDILCACGGLSEDQESKKAWSMKFFQDALIVLEQLKMKINKSPDVYILLSSQPSALLDSVVAGVALLFADGVTPDSKGQIAPSEDLQELVEVLAAARDLKYCFDFIPSPERTSDEQREREKRAYI